MHPRRAVALALALWPAFVSAPARAWQEAHELGQESYVRVDTTGTAAIEAKVRWRVVRGPLKSIDLSNVDESALEPTVTVSGDDGRDLLAHVERKDNRSLRVTIDEPRAPLRGVLTFDFRWHTDLIASRALVRDNTTYRLTWFLPAAADGFDGSRTVFDFPAAPDAPKPIVAETGLVDDGAIASLRRDPGRDALELVRPHVARGESAAWTLRVDPRALSAGAAPPPAPEAPSRWSAEPDRIREASAIGGLLGVALSFGLLVAAKTRAFASACSARGVKARALLPVAGVPRSWLAGVALAAGVALQVSDRPTFGGFFVALAALAAALRAPEARPSIRGPGRWLALRPHEAFERAAATGHWLDAATRAGRLTLLGATLLGVALARWAGYFAVEDAWLFAMDFTVILPLFVTGTASQLPPRSGGGSAPWLARSFRRLRKAPGLRAAPWGRLALDGAIDEVRILVVPRAAVPGVLGIEIGQAWSSTSVGWASVPELLVRVLDGSAAAARLAQLTGHVKAAAFVGRRPDERVVRLTPRAPTAASAVALTRRLAGELADRRAEALGGLPESGDRRGRPAVRPNVLEPGVSVYGA